MSSKMTREKNNLKKEVIVAFDCGLDYVIGKEANYRIVNVNHKRYLAKSKPGLKSLLQNGYRFGKFNNWSRSPELYNSMFLENNNDYFQFCRDYISTCRNADIVIQTGGTDILPFQLLDEYFPIAKKVLYFVDDPHATFAYGTPYAFAYDYAVYISDSYNDKILMGDFLSRIGFNRDRIFKLPLCFSNLENYLVNYTSPEDLIHREKCVYVGGYYGNKAKRLYEISQRIGKKNFQIYGNYPLFGYGALLRLFSNEVAFTGRVKRLTTAERESIYNKAAVGFNLHLSFSPKMECGNARTYELPFRGIAQVLDRPPIPKSSLPFKEDTEALYYDTLSEAAEKIQWLLSRPKERAQIAFNGYKRATSDYIWNNAVANLLDKIYLA